MNLPGWCNEQSAWLGRHQMKLPSDARLLIVRLRALVFIALAIGMATLLGLVAWPDDLPTGAIHRPVTSAISVAVIGDSGSQSYQDKITFPPGSRERGGALRERTFQ